MFAIVAADVARAYLDMRAHRRELVVLRKNIAAARSNLDLAQTRFNRGLTNELDVSLAQRQLATLEADRAPLAAKVDVSRHAIAVLIGHFPEELTRELARIRRASGIAAEDSAPGCRSTCCVGVLTFAKRSVGWPGQMPLSASPSPNSFQP